MTTCDSTKPRLPAGPKGVPVLGATLQWKGPETNLEWTKEFGAIYSVRIGPNQLVYLNTIELVEQYLEKEGHAFLGRPGGPAAIANGLLFGMGERWQENRKAFMRALWKSSLDHAYESNIQHEADIVMGELANLVGQPILLDEYFLPAFTSRLATLLLGEPMERDSDDMKRLMPQMKELEEVDLTSKATQMFLKINTLRRPLEVLSGHSVPDMFKMSAAVQGVVHDWIKRRREAIQAAGGAANPGALLDQILQSEEYKDRLQPEGFDDEMDQSLMDMFYGGVTSSLSAFEFFCLFLIHHQDVQTKVKAEIDKATASDIQVTWANREHMPYTQATLIETLRLASVTPSSLPHVATEIVVIEGVYEIPKGAFVLAGIFSLHRDSRFYADPEQFRPERHLDQHGKCVTPKSFRPFGVGERMCLGYHLSQIELFLFITRLLAKFHIRAVDEANAPPFDAHMRIVRRLKPFSCVVEPWST